MLTVVCCPLSRLRTQFSAVKFFLDLVESVIADLLDATHPQKRVACCGDRAEAQRIGGEIVGRDATAGLAFRTKQHLAVFEAKNLGLFGRVALDRTERCSVDGGTGSRRFARDRI